MEITIIISLHSSIKMEQNFLKENSMKATEGYTLCPVLCIMYFLFMWLVVHAINMIFGKCITNTKLSVLRDKRNHLFVKINNHHWTY